MSSGRSVPSVQWGPTPRELRELLRSPEALQAVIDWHEVQITEADAMGYSTKENERRQKELERIRDQLIQERNRG